MPAETPDLHPTLNLALCQIQFADLCELEVRALARTKSWRVDEVADMMGCLSVKMKAPAVPQRRILVVDDEPFVCDAVKMMLSFDGHSVETASSGQDALALFEKSKFDVVITDFAMPAMKGDELALAIKARDPEQPVVMITAYAEMLQSSGRQLPGVDFMISKPFLLENLREAISRVTPTAPKT